MDHRSFPFGTRGHAAFVAVALTGAVAAAFPATGAESESPFSDLLMVPGVDVGAPPPDAGEPAEPEDAPIGLPGRSERDSENAPMYPRLNAMSLGNSLVRTIPLYRHPDERLRIRDSIDATDPDAAIAQLRQLAQAHPDEGAVLAILAIVLDRFQPQNKESADLINRAVRAAPRSEIVRAARAEHLLLHDRMDEAREVCRAAIEESPENPPVWAREILLHVAVNRQDLATALAEADELLRVDTDNLVMILSLGNLARYAATPEAAMARYEVIVRRTRDPIARNNLAYLYSMTGRLQQAYDIAEPLAREYPESIPVLDTLAAIQLGRGKPRDAIEILDRILEQAPRFAPAHLHKALAHADLDQMDEAAQSLRQALMTQHNDLEEAEVREARRRIPLGS